MDRGQRVRADRVRQHHCRMIRPDSIGLMLRSPPCPKGEVGVSKHRKSAIADLRTNTCRSRVNPRSVAAPSFETPALRQDEGGATRNILLICALIRAGTKTTIVSFAAEIPQNERKPGYEFMGRDSRAMQ